MRNNTVIINCVRNRFSMTSETLKYSVDDVDLISRAQRTNRVDSSSLDMLSKESFVLQIDSQLSNAMST